MFEEVITRLKHLELTGPAEYLRSNTIAGIKRMPIRFTAVAKGHLSAQLTSD